MSRTNRRADSSEKYNVETKINAIMRYYGVSMTAATYMFHRRKRGCPYYGMSDSKYLEWNLTLQNGLIMLDSYFGFSWDMMAFGEEYDVMRTYDIFERADEHVIMTLRKTRPTDGWTIVAKKPKFAAFDKSLLRSMGFILNGDSLVTDFEQYQAKIEKLTDIAIKAKKTAGETITDTQYKIIYNHVSAKYMRGFRRKPQNKKIENRYKIND